MMNNRIVYFFLVAFVATTTLSAQYTEILNANRPGSSQGAFSVGTNILQFESGLSIGKEEHRLLFTEANTFSWDYAIRYGVLKEELEVSLMGNFQSNKVTDTRGANNFERNFANFKSNTLGAKYLLYDPYRNREAKGPNLYSWKANNRIQWADLIPAISVYAGANFDITEDNPFTPEAEKSISPKFVVSTQNNFIGGFVFVTNIIVNRVTTDNPEYGYILTLTHATNRYFSIFLENQGIKSDFYADQLLRGGVAVLINKDLQVDLSGTLNFKDTPSLWRARLGVAYRFDMHREDEFIEEKGKSGRDKRKKYKEQKKEKNERNKRKDLLEDDGDGSQL
ncbi:transporter [uncultured Marixanthomonas sp.]|uniref:transporter n=1 Tax=uncultured Marixanthomonas sp. TaxID=757245 RepID=UPI0030D991A0|tara:strand:- start:148065 stop:149075 length:1011 start_codon:yes stop_codon:yes gene_type:complete